MTCPTTKRFGSNASFRTSEIMFLEYAKVVDTTVIGGVLVLDDFVYHSQADRFSCAFAILFLCDHTP